MLIPEAVAYYDAMAAERAEASGAINSENLAPVPPLNAHAPAAAGHTFPLGVPPYAPPQQQGHTALRLGGRDNAPGGYMAGGGGFASARGAQAAAPAPWHAYPPLLPGPAACGPIGNRHDVVEASPLLVQGLQSRVSPAVFGSGDPRFLNHTPGQQQAGTQAAQPRLPPHGRVALGGFGSIALAQAGGLMQGSSTPFFAPAPAQPPPAPAQPLVKKAKSKPGYFLLPVPDEAEGVEGVEAAKEMGVGKREKKRASKFRCVPWCRAACDAHARLTYFSSLAGSSHPSQQRL
jgi:hypothetical protein